MQNNLATLLAQERKLEARGIEKESLAGLLPNVSAAAYQANLTLNLAALGFQPGTFPGIKTFIGPFNNFDARVRLQQILFDHSLGLLGRNRMQIEDVGDFQRYGVGKRIFIVENSFLQRFCGLL